MSVADGLADDSPTTVPKRAVAATTEAKRRADILFLPLYSKAVLWLDFLAEARASLVSGPCQFVSERLAPSRWIDELPD